MAKLAVITGGTGGLGKTVTQSFLQEGYDVIATYRSDEELKDLLEMLGEDKERLEAIRVDVLREAGLDELATRISKRNQPIDALVCLVGGFAMGTLGENITETYARMMDLNVKSFLLTCNALVPFMQDKKKTSYRHIVGVSSRRAFEISKNMGVYAASKAAVATLIQSMAKEFLSENITVNGIAPSTIDTPANRRDMPKADTSTWVTPQQLADAILFLCSDQANAISGTIVPVYGKA